MNTRGTRDYSHKSYLIEPLDWEYQELLRADNIKTKTEKLEKII